MSVRRCGELLQVPPNGTRADRAAAATLAVARTIQARSQGGQPSSQDLAVYTTLHEDQRDSAAELALAVGAWSGTVTARLWTSGHLPGEDVAAFGDHLTVVPEMKAARFYPNPINAGDTSASDATVERWWDGVDWTDRARVREGQTWTEAHVSLFMAPKN